MHRKTRYGEIDDVIGAHRSHYIRRRLEPGAPVSLEGCDNLDIRRPCCDGLTYPTHKNQDNEIPHHVILLQLTPASDRKTVPGSTRREAATMGARTLKRSK
jgi:hypothetical protein